MVTLSGAKIQRRNAWRYHIREVASGDGHRPVSQSLKDAQELAGLPPGRWLGSGLGALGLTEGGEVSERQLELLFGEGRHPDADRIERGLLDDGVDAATARGLTVLGEPIEEIERGKQIPLRGMDFTFRPQASLVVLWALGDDHTRPVIERAHERAGSVVTLHSTEAFQRWLALERVTDCTRAWSRSMRRASRFPESWRRTSPIVGRRSRRYPARRIEGFFASWWMRKESPPA
ncbi:relaxase domain-containing protein [Streptomyces sp. NPDC055992]|uniref:relaxase domain-containing protein n=1 Tax=Streptomyces sp. NPDC055992 TaxID=3345673 RepID=UPI0035D7850A